MTSLRRHEVNDGCSRWYYHGLAQNDLLSHVFQVALFLFVQMNPNDISEDILDKQILSQHPQHSKSTVNPQPIHGWAWLSLRSTRDPEISKNCRYCDRGYTSPTGEQYKKDEIDASQWCHGG